MSRKYVKLDDADTLFFNRQIEYVKTKTYDKKYPTLLARTFIPVSYEIPTGAQNVVYYTYDAIGMAKIIADGARDLPRVDLVGRQNTAPIRSIGDSYGYTLQEIRTAAMMGMALDAKKGNAAKQAAMQLEDSIALLGDDDTGLIGLLTHPNVPDVAIPADGVQNGTTISTPAAALWINKLPQQIIRDINLLISAIVDGSKNTEAPNALLLPLGARNLLATTQMSATSSQSILQWLLGNSPYIKTVDVWPRLSGQGVGGTDVMIAYTKDPDKLVLEVPQEFEQLPVQEHGLEFEVPCHMRTGGVTIYYPLSLAKADGF